MFCVWKILEFYGVLKVWVEWVKENWGVDYKFYLDFDVKCLICWWKILIDFWGVDGLVKNFILENVIEWFKEERKVLGIIKNLII